MVADSERCGGCGLTGDDAWHVEAELYTCPTCEDRDRGLESLREMKSTAGWRSRFRQLLTEGERMNVSSAVRFTREGAETRARWRRQRKV